MQSTQEPTQIQANGGEGTALPYERITNVKKSKDNRKSHRWNTRVFTTK